MDAMASITDRVGDLGGYLREQREHARLSVRQLATLAGVSNPYLSQVERGLRNPSAEVLQQIAKGLRISAEALYIRAGILDQENRPDVEAAVAADPHLNDRQRRVLLDIYTSFRSENERAAREAADDAAPARPTRPARAARSTRPTRPTRTARSTRSTRSAASTDSTGAAGSTGAEATKATAKRTSAKRATGKRAAAKRAAAATPSTVSDPTSSTGTTTDTHDVTAPDAL
jgi:transcriptional regulator with XRE-family HTH domain